ncbi:galactoside alpha-(1,2)-fucosyltransferase 2-like isoform X2 [Haliotis rufescens]|uniref:galactoside alpha-(1,2)-fucosyltransferase 2-like isoform X2 n=1 Tax=Haliotis rufescens TaxID=6454 RepID=UPI00201FA13B|nr:galactoside alpha-(1,2)-fucosyltransferase 2-like isoform X2 [Haliotis rufescens]
MRGQLHSGCMKHTLCQVAQGLSADAVMCMRRTETNSVPCVSPAPLYIMSRRRQLVTVTCIASTWILLMALTFHYPSMSRLESVLKYQRRIADLEAQLKQAMRLIPTTTATTITTTTTPKPCRDDFNVTFETENRFICTHTSGGIGNFMFAFASVYGMASAAHKSVLIQQNNPLLKYFNVSAKVVGDVCICKSAKFVFEGRHCSYNDKLMNLTEFRNYNPGFYFQSWMYFRDVTDDIRRQFTFVEDVRAQALVLLKAQVQAYIKRESEKHVRVTPQKVITVGVHVRRGDIARRKGFVNYGYGLAPPEYFTKAIQYFRTKYNHTLFIVCSDNFQWSKANVTGNDVIYMERNPFQVDLAVLAHCNHSIMSVGTFGWWASFLAGGETIYYKHPARDGSSLRKQFSANMSDYFYPGWIGME